MAKIQSIRALLTERLTVVANEIFVAVEKTIAEYEEEVGQTKVDNAARLQRLLEEVNRTKEENARLQRMLDLVFKPNIQLRKTDASRSHDSGQPHCELEFSIKMEEPETQRPVKVEVEEELWNIPESIIETEPDGEGESEPEPSNEPSVNPQAQNLEPDPVVMETGMEKPKQRTMAERVRHTFEDKRRLGTPSNRKEGQFKSEANIDPTECTLPPTLQAEHHRGSTSGLLRHLQSHVISRPLDQDKPLMKMRKIEACSEPKSPVKEILSELAALCSFSSNAISSSAHLRSARHKDQYTMPQNQSQHLRNCKSRPSDASLKPGEHTVQFLNAFTESYRENPVPGVISPSAIDVARHKERYAMTQNHSRQMGHCKLRPSDAIPKPGGDPVQLLTAFTESYRENPVPRVIPPSESDVLPSSICAWPPVTPTQKSSEGDSAVSPIEQH